jgi:signal transduction histidine kinase
MATEKIDLRKFLAETLEDLGPTIPDRVVFSCSLGDTPHLHADPEVLRRVLTDLVTNVCESGDEVRLRTGTVAGRSGPHAFIEVGRPDTGTRIVVPIPVFRRDMRLAGIEPAEGSRQSL